MKNRSLHPPFHWLSNKPNIIYVGRQVWAVHQWQNGSLLVCSYKQFRFSNCRYRLTLIVENEDSRIQQWTIGL